ncbi:toll/interleukin-1 receptor domain-containing protein [Nostoc sp.]|uniref:toll/interleukin-1 receptor domain-containing protein n=1 Tax=Nostoc sp. TaxID=1180 RepID=UPI002FF66A3D
MAKSLSTEQQQRLQQWRQTLQAEWEQRCEKLKRLRIDSAIEAGTAVKFQLEKQIQYEEAKLNDIDQQLNDVKAQLQLLSHTTIIPNTISQRKVHQTPELLSSTRIIEVFISYSRQKDDEKLLNVLVDKHLNNLEEIKILHEGKTIGGQDNKVEIEKHLNSSDIILLLISPNFLKDYNNKFEINLARAREKAIKATVVPVLLTKIFGWERFTFANLKLGDLEPLPQKDKFITDRRVWKTNNDAFYAIAEGLEKVKTKIVEKT